MLDAASAADSRADNDPTTAADSRAAATIAAASLSSGTVDSKESRQQEANGTAFFTKIGTGITNQIYFQEQALGSVILPICDPPEEPGEVRIQIWKCTLRLVLSKALSKPLLR
jgi:hypothetical protein